MKCICFKKLYQDFVRLCFFSGVHFEISFTTEMFHKVEKNQEIFNRIFLNAVTLIGAQKKENKNTLNFAVVCSIQRVLVSNNRMELVDPDIMTREEVIVLTRDARVGAGKGSIYQHNCPSCGGPVKDTLDIKCSYCGSLLNSTANDWVVSALMNRSEFTENYDMKR